MKIGNPGADKWAIQIDEASAEDKDIIKAITTEDIFTLSCTPKTGQVVKVEKT